MSTQSNSNAETSQPSVNEAQGRVLAEAFWRLVHHYRLTRKEQAVLLGMKHTRRIKELDERKEIPLEADKFARIGNLIGIHKNLRILFPENREVVYAWMKTPRKEFGNKSALQWIEENEVDSFKRLFTVRRMLDQMRTL